MANLRRWRVLWLRLLLGIAGALALPVHPGSVFAQEPGSWKQQWEEWFYGQRLYGLGYIPEEALATALAQRDAGGATAGFGLQSNRRSALSAESARWVSLGPAGILSLKNDLLSGRVTSLAIAPLRPSTVYIAAAGGGVWKSTQRGLGWAPISDQLPSLASGAVAVDPFSGEVWYGTGELNFCRDCYYGAGVFRSADGGLNWTRVNPDNFRSSPTSVIVFDRRASGTLFIGRSTALWKSTDGGERWHVVLRGVITDVVLHPADSSLAYAAAGNFSGSVDNGVYRSTDGGETWSLLAGGLPEQAGMGRIALAVSPATPAVVYALIARSSDFTLNGLYRSLDGGQSWSRLNSIPETLFTEEGQGQGLFNLLVEVDPKDSAVLYVGGVGLWKSTDFGGSWRDLSANAGLPEDPREIVFDPSDPATFYLIGDSGVWRSSDGGESFVNLNRTLAVTQLQTVGLHPNDANLAVGGTQDNGTILYRGSFAWEQARPGDSGATFYDAVQPQLLYTVANRHSLRRSEDGGRSFRLIAQGLDVSDRVLFYPPFVADPNQPEMLYFGTQRIWQSRDRGEHWVPLSGDLTGGGSATVSALAIAPSSSSVLYAGTSDGRVQVSRDRGSSWSLSAPLPQRFVTSIAVHPQMHTRAFLGLSGFGTGHVFRTEDVGASWQDISGNLPDIPVNTVLVDALEPETVYVGTDLGVFVLGGDGSWIPLREGIPNAVVLGLSQNSSTGLLAAATHGRGAFALITGGPAVEAPRLDALVNGAGFQHAPLAPGMIASLFGANLVTTAAFAESPLLFSIGNTVVSVNGVLAPLFFVSPTQVNFQVPFEVVGSTALVALRNGKGTAFARIPLGKASPGIFANQGQGSLYHGNAILVSEAAPARVGEELVLYGSGLGATDPPVITGTAAPFSPPARTYFPVTVRVGAIPADVRFAGLTPGLAGLYQVNFVVPPGLAGNVPLVLEMEGVSSNSVTFPLLP